MMARLTSRRPPTPPRSTAMSPGCAALDALVAPARMNASTIWRSLMSMMVTAAPMAFLDVSRCGESGAGGDGAQGRDAGCGQRIIRHAPELQLRVTRRRGERGGPSKTVAPDRLDADPNVL